MTLGSRLNEALTQLLLQQQTNAVDYSRDQVSNGRGGHGAHGDPSRRPTGNSRPLVQQWAERFERLIEVLEQEAGLRPAQTKEPVKQARELRSRIHEYEGYDPVFVAFVERTSVESVRRIRKEKGLNVATGERLTPRERPLTAPARDSLRILQNVVGGEV